MDSIALGLLHLGTLYDLDSRGRILSIREPDPPPPPRLHVLRTPEGALALVRNDLPDDLAGHLLALARTEPWSEDDALDAAPVHDDDYRDLLAPGGPIEREYSGPSLVLLGPFPDGQRATRIDEGNRALLDKHFADDAAHLDVRSPVWAIIDREDAITICMSSRNPGPAVPAGVFTVEAYRRLGFATAVVSAWAAEVTASGRLPLYGTTWDNEASQHIAASLGGVMYGSDYWLR